MAAIATQPVTIPEADLPNLDSISFCQASLNDKLKKICDDFIASQDPELFNDLNTTKAATALGRADDAALKAAAQQLVDEILTFGETSYDDVLGVKNDSSPEEVLRSWRLRGCTIRPYLSHGEAPLQQSARKAFIALMCAARKKSISERNIYEVVEWEGLVDLNALPDDDGTPPTEASVKEPPQEINNVYEKATADMVALKLNPQDVEVRKRLNTHNLAIMEHNKKMGKIRRDLYQWIIPLEFFSPQYMEAAKRYKSLDDKPADEVVAKEIDKLKEVVDTKIRKDHFKQSWSIPSASAYVGSSKEIKRIMSCATAHERLSISTDADVATKVTAFRSIVSRMHPVFAFRQDAHEALNQLCTAAEEVGISDIEVSFGREWDGGSWEDTRQDEDVVPEPPSAIKKLYSDAKESMISLSGDPGDGAVISVVEEINEQIKKLSNDASGSGPIWNINVEWWCQTFRDMAEQEAILRNDIEDRGAREKIENLIKNIDTYLKRSHLPSNWSYGSAEKVIRKVQGELDGQKEILEAVVMDMKSMFDDITTLQQRLNDQSPNESQMSDVVKLVRSKYSMVGELKKKLEDANDRVRNSRSVNEFVEAVQASQNALKEARQADQECDAARELLASLPDSSQKSASNAVQYPWATMPLSGDKVVIGYKRSGKGYQVCVQDKVNGRLVRELKAGAIIGRGVVDDYCETPGSCNMQKSSAQFDNVDLKARDLVKLHFVATQQPKVRNADRPDIAPGSYCCVELRDRGIFMLTMTRFRRMMGKHKADEEMEQVCNEQNTPVPWEQQPLTTYVKPTATKNTQNKQQIVAGVAGISHDTTNLESRISILENKVNDFQAGLPQLLESTIKKAMSTFQATFEAELAKALQAHSHQ
ncbi:uncharacterized protein FPRO_13674 [Fusarium proliferatum ET1]|uniref:Uncharacterized protein n=1 Tax=Fusarium proliferatum (strain ET1) TaxID=1227346 RepID=A0A1L7VTY4_FUSPR|nr:uncharacterized protein FPRO_13674 [Fusarium proliferatum ET1]CZR43867.1 uncharacterized protein FPRO_13674 [Fusarium proliferatum ET1]